jgi:cytochrome c556
LVLFGVVVLNGLSGFEGLSGPDPSTDAVMRAKLTASQKVLAGIALSDFQSIQTNAATLITLSSQRGWAALQTPEYELFSTRFRIASESLSAAATSKDMESLLGSYQDLTRSCVGCHTYLRDGRPKGSMLKRE